MSDDRYVSAGTVARSIGVSIRTVERQCERGQIPSHRTGGDEGHWRIPKAWLDGVLDRSRRVIVRKREG